MGKPKFSRKKYETPSHPWQEDRIKAENELIKKYGLKNKREIWKAQTKLRNYRGQARELLAKVETGDVQSKKESNQLLMRLNRFNILPGNATLDDVLALETESIINRRLQTLTYLKGLASTPTQARQLISHGHIAIGDRRVTVPSYMVAKDEEGEITYTTDSPLNDTMHPARPRAEFKSIPIKKEVQTKTEEKKSAEKPVKETTETPLKKLIEQPEESISQQVKEKPSEKETESTEKKPIEESKSELLDKKIEESEKEKKPQKEIKTKDNKEGGK